MGRAERSDTIANGYTIASDPDLIGKIREAVRAALVDAKCEFAVSFGGGWHPLGGASADVVLNNIARDVARALAASAKP